MLFRKNDTQSDTGNEKPVSNALLVLQLRKKMHVQLALLACCLAVMSISTYAFITRAWYANNREVQQDHTTIQSGTVTPSLYIRPSSTADKMEAVSISSSAESDCKLFPISTNDLQNWYYVNEFSFVTTEWTDPATDTTYSISKQVASAYTAANVNVSAKGTGFYNNSYEANTTKVAFFKATSNLYVSGGDSDTLDVYLATDDAIKVTISDSEKNESTNGFYKSIRVGIKVSGGAFIIFAPVAEASGTFGNSSGAAVAAMQGKFLAIASGSLSDASGVVKTDISAYQGHDGTSTGFFTKGTTKLGTADANGLDIEVYVWLEGTDADALVGSSDGNADVGALNVEVTYVGVAPDGALYP